MLCENIFIILMRICRHWLEQKEPRTILFDLGYGRCAKAKLAREVESAGANQDITYSEAVQRVSKGIEQKGKDFVYKVYESKQLVDVATQTSYRGLKK